MKIAIDLTPLYGRKRTGVEMYAIDLYKALLTTEHEIVPIFHVKNEIDNNPFAFIIPKKNRLWLENISLIRAVQKIEADVALFPIFPPPYTIYGGKTKILPTLHDFAFLKFRDTLNAAAKYYLTPKYLRMFKKADGIITISETIKSMLADYTRKPVWNCGENISIEYKDCASKTSLNYLKRWNLSEGSYIISVSTIEPRKNFKYLLKVIKPMLDATGKKLVLVGRKGWGKDGELHSLIENMGDRLIFTEYVEIECLISLYRYAHAFALLSVDEGFGRTPFEAVACGCRKVILSDIPIFRETFGNDGLFLPLDRVEECQKILLDKDIPLVPDNFEIPFDVLEKRIGEVLEKM